MSFLPLTLSDLDAIKELQPEGWTDIVPHNKYFIESPYCYPIKVVVNNKLAGIATYIMHADTVWLAHIIIHKDYRGQGLGTAITQELISKIDRKRFKTIYLIATELGEPVYKKLGFVAENEYVFFKDGQPDKNILVSPSIIPFEEKYRQQLLNLDKDVSGEDRQNKLNETIDSSMLYVQNGHVLGLYSPTLGEGMIIAADNNAGIELMKLRLTTKENAVVPTENKAAVDILLKNKFIEVRKAKRMLLGERRAWKPELLFNRVNGQIG